MNFLSWALLVLLTSSVAPPSGAFIPPTSHFAPQCIDSGPTAKKHLFVAPALATRHSVSPASGFDDLAKAHNSFVYAARPDLALFDRIMRTAQANLNASIQSIEMVSTEKAANEVLAKIQADMIKLMQAYVMSVRRQRNILQQKQQAEFVGNLWYHRAQDALGNGYEMDAREALFKRQLYVEAAEKLQTQFRAEIAATRRMYDAAWLLDEKLGEAVSKKRDLISRAKTAHSIKKVNDMLRKVAADASLEAFSKLEETIEAMEAEADTSSDGILGSASTDQEDAGLETAFRAPDKEESVERELEGITNDTTSDSVFLFMKSDDEIAHELEQLGRRVLETGYL